MLGILYTLLAALAFGYNNASVRRGVITGTVTQVVVISMPVGLAMFVVAAAAFGQLGRLGEFTPSALVLLASAGLVHFVFGRFCNYRSMQAMGAVLSAPIQQWSLLVTLMLAVVFLQETLDLMKLIGIALVVLGPTLVVGAQQARARSARNSGRTPTEATASATFNPAKFKPKLVQGYTFSILSCLAYGSSPILVRGALEGTGLALAGGVVSYAAATLVIVLILLLPGPRRNAASVGRGNAVRFAWTGATVCVSQIFLYLAMAIAPVTVVQPLMRLSTLFRTLFSWTMNRDHEVFDRGILVAIGVSLVGALFLALDPGMVLDWIGGPQWLARAFAWNWP